MTQATDSDIRDIKNAIGSLKDSIGSLREETRVGLTRLDGDIKELRSEVKALDSKFDERTKLGFWGFVLRGVVLALIIGVGGYMLPIIAEYVHKLRPL